MNTPAFSSGSRNLPALNLITGFFWIIIGAAVLLALMILLLPDKIFLALSNYLQIIAALAGALVLLYVWHREGGPEYLLYAAGALGLWGVSNIVWYVNILILASSVRVSVRELRGRAARGRKHRMSHLEHRLGRPRAPKIRACCLRGYERDAVVCCKDKEPPTDFERISEPGAEARERESQARSSPAARPRAATCSAIFREASSIISPSNMTAPRRPPSACTKASRIRSARLYSTSVGE